MSTRNLDWADTEDLYPEPANRRSEDEPVYCDECGTAGFPGDLTDCARCGESLCGDCYSECTCGESDATHKARAA